MRASFEYSKSVPMYILVEYTKFLILGIIATSVQEDIT